MIDPLSSSKAAMTTSGTFSFDAPGDAARAAELRRVKLLATLVLAATFLLFVVAKLLLPLHPGFGFVAAFAEAAGVTEPILYRHFKSKQDLFVAIVRAMSQQTQAEWETRIANLNDPAIVDRFSEQHFPDCFREYAELLDWDEYWHTTLDTQNGVVLNSSNAGADQTYYGNLTINAGGNISDAGRNIWIQSGTLTLNAGTGTIYLGSNVAEVLSTVAVTAAGATSGVVASNVSGCTFTYTAGTSERVGMASLLLQMASNNQQVQLLHQVHLVNAP